MARTVRDLITQAARKGGVIGKTSNLNQEEYEEALNELNDLIEHLENDGLWFSNRDHLDVSSQQTADRIVLKRAGSLTVAQGDATVVKIPSRISAISYLIGQQWRPLTPMSADQLENNIRLNIPITYANYYTFNTVDADTAVIQLYPIPSPQTYRISYQNTKADYDLDSETTYPPGYDGYLTWAMAAQLAKINGMDPSVAEVEAQKRLTLLENRQVQARMLRSNSSRGYYNVQTGGWSNGSYDFR